MKVYTYNDKVLVNSANDKWLKEKEAPAGFVMNGSNATVIWQGTSALVSWESPSYPDNYNGNGKHYTVTNNNSASTGATLFTGLMYTASTQPTGFEPQAIPYATVNTIGTSTGNMTANSNQATYGKYLGLIFIDATEEGVRAYLANLTITILD